MLVTTDSPQDRQLAPIALQRWESDGGAVPARPVNPRPFAMTPTHGTANDSVAGL